MGVDHIEVSDNGSGIDPENYSYIALKSHTSKLKDFEDLKSVSSFGFRGEALNAICELSGSFSIFTKKHNQTTGCHLSFGRNGRCEFTLYIKYK
jgi:DNA mismatch repair protein PMS2